MFIFQTHSMKKYDAGDVGSWIVGRKSGNKEKEDHPCTQWLTGARAFYIEGGNRIMLDERVHNVNIGKDNFEIQMQENIYRRTLSTQCQFNPTNVTDDLRVMRVLNVYDPEQKDLSGNPRCIYTHMIKNDELGADGSFSGLTSDLRKNLPVSTKLVAGAQNEQVVSVDKPIHSVSTDSKTRAEVHTYTFKAGLSYDKFLIFRTYAILLQNPKDADLLSQLPVSEFGDQELLQRKYPTIEVVTGDTKKTHPISCSAEMSYSLVIQAPRVDLQKSELPLDIVLGPQGGNANYSTELRYHNWTDSKTGKTHQLLDLSKSSGVFMWKLLQSPLSIPLCWDGEGPDYWHIPASGVNIYSAYISYLEPNKRTPGSNTTPVFYLTTNRITSKSGGRNEVQLVASSVDENGRSLGSNAWFLYERDMNGDAIGKPVALAQMESSGPMGLVKDINITIWDEHMQNMLASPVLSKYVIGSGSNRFTTNEWGQLVSKGSNNFEYPISPDVNKNAGFRFYFDENQIDGATKKTAKQLAIERAVSEGLLPVQSYYLKTKSGETIPLKAVQVGPNEFELYREGVNDWLFKIKGSGAGASVESNPDAIRVLQDLRDQISALPIPVPTRRLAKGLRPSRADGQLYG